MPSPLRLTGIALLTSLLFSQAAYASKYEDDANQAISFAVRTLRIQNEQVESTDQYFKTLPLYNIKSFSYPVTWGFNTGETPSEPTLLFSKKLGKIVADKMVYKTPNFPNGMVNVGAPLRAYHTAVYAPVLANSAAKRVYVKPIIPSMLANDPLHNSYIAFCSFKSSAQTLGDLEASMKNITTVGNVPRFDGESYIPNVYSSTVADAIFMGLPAKKFTLVFDSRINKTSVRLKYEGLYALKSGNAICAEVVAPEKGFEALRKNLDPILTSIVPSYEFSRIELIKTSNEVILPKPLVLPANFNGFTTTYHATEKNVFYRICEEDKMDCFIVVPEADPKTFTTIVDKNSITPGISYYAKDSKHVYNGYAIIPMADPETFTLNDGIFPSDKRRIYYHSTPLQGMNPKKIKRLNVFYITDGRKVFYMDKLLRGVDVPSFKPVTDKKSEPGTDWGYDNFRVYYKDKEVSQLTPKNLKVFSSFVVKDDHSVLCNEYPLKDVDAPTFKRLNGYYAKDKRHGYILFSGWVSPKVPCLFFIIDEADPATLRGFVKDTWMYDNLAIDSKHIFLNGDIIPNIDLKNFNPDALYERMEAENMSTSKTGIGKD